MPDFAPIVRPLKPRLVGVCKLPVRLVRGICCTVYFGLRLGFPHACACQAFSLHYAMQ